MARDDGEVETAMSKPEAFTSQTALDGVCTRVETPAGVALVNGWPGSQFPHGWYATSESGLLTCKIDDAGLLNLHIVGANLDQPPG